MPKKEKIWTMGNKGPTGPWVWQGWVKGTKKPWRMVAFGHQHITDQVEGKTFVKAVKQPEEKDEMESMPMGPKGAEIHRPAEYDKGFKILRAWIDENGGPPEEIRVKLRELWIDYDKAPRKTTRYSARHKKRY